MNINEVSNAINEVQLTQTEAFLDVNNAIDNHEKKLNTIAESYEGDDLGEFSAEVVQEADLNKVRVLHNYNEKVRGKMDLRIEELTRLWDAHNDKIKQLRDEQANINDQVVEISKKSNPTEQKEKLDELRKKYGETTKAINEEQKKMLEIDKQIRNDFDKLYSRLVKFPNGSPTKGTEKASDEKYRPALNKAYENEKRTKKELEESEKKDNGESKSDSDK